MSVVFENETGEPFDFEVEDTVNAVVEACLSYVGCPFEAMVCVTVVDKEEIHRLNKEFRQMDRPTDVLSFPLVDYETAGDFSFLEEEGATIQYFDCDSGELALGDIVICADKVKAQAAEYGHSEKRELAFLTAHSMFHLFGYDHMEDQERIRMEQMQSEVLGILGILR